jgi:hypothetical protein
MSDTTAHILMLERNFFPPKKFRRVTVIVKSNKRYDPGESIQIIRQKRLLKELIVLMSS